MKEWKGKKTVRENLLRKMPNLVDEYFSAGDTALAPGTSWEEIHRFRLLTKRFRYTLEIFRSAYGPGLDTRIESLRNLQTLLGDINDSIVSFGMLEGVPGMETVRAHLREKADNKTVHLRTRWAEEFAPPAQRQRWRRYLTQYACRPGRVRMSRTVPEAASVQGDISPQNA